MISDAVYIKSGFNAAFFPHDRQEFENVFVDNAVIEKRILIAKHPNLF